MSASLAFQMVARTQLATDAAVTALIPADAILDKHARPELERCIVLGEDMELPADEVVGRYTKLTATFHIWIKEPGLAGAKLVATAIRRALRGKTWTLDDYRCIDTRFEGARFLRDPDGETSHGVVTFEATIEELA